jgi:hypothetical protein
MLFCFEELFFENIRNSRTHVLNVHLVRLPIILDENQELRRHYPRYAVCTYYMSHY